MISIIGAVSIATLLIGYYHGVLLRDIDADLLTDKMCSTGLLTDVEKSVISFGHTVHHRNWLLLEHVRHFELQLLLEFCKLLKEEWIEIGSHLITGRHVCSLGATYIATHTYVTEFDRSWLLHALGLARMCDILTYIIKLALIDANWPF